MSQLQYEREYCEQCQGWMVICPTCGNNSCNGTYGRQEDGSWVPDCPKAYDLMLGDSLMSLPVRERKATVYLKGGKTAIVPSSEVEDYIKANADLLESAIIKTRGARRRG